MKKIIALLLTSLMAVALLNACGGSSKKAAPTQINFTDYFEKNGWFDASDITKAAYIVIDPTAEGYDGVGKEVKDQYVCYAFKYDIKEWGLIRFDGTTTDPYFFDYSKIVDQLNNPNATWSIKLASQMVYDDHMIEAQKDLICALANGTTPEDGYIPNYWYMFTEEELIKAKNGLNEETFNFLKIETGK